MYLKPTDWICLKSISHSACVYASAHGVHQYDRHPPNKPSIANNGGTDAEATVSRRPSHDERSSVTRQRAHIRFVVLPPICHVPCMGVSCFGLVDKKLHRARNCLCSASLRRYAKSMWNGLAVGWRSKHQTIILKESGNCTHTHSLAGWLAGYHTSEQ